MIVHWREFLGVVAVITIVPGPDTVLVIRNAVRRGRGAGLLTALGCSIGLAVWAVAASLGLATLLGASAGLFRVVRAAGALYLVVLGVGLMQRGWRTTRARTTTATHDGGRFNAARSDRDRLAGKDVVAARSAILEGMVADLLNPKAAAFFTALLPQFVGAGDSSVRAFMTAFPLGLIAASAALVGLTSYALVAARAGRYLRRPSLYAVLDVVSGLLLVALGFGMMRRYSAFTHRV